jgi:hypothetical protein
MGIEPTPVSRENPAFVAIGGAESGALAPTNSPELAYLIECWPALPDAIRRAVLALVRSAEGKP